MLMKIECLRTYYKINLERANDFRLAAFEDSHRPDRVVTGINGQSLNHLQRNGGRMG
jgi:hypothetical protein